MNLTKTDKTIKAFEAEIKRLLQNGKTARQAVNEAYKKYPVMKILEKELQKQLEEEMKRGMGKEISPTAIHDALSLVWSPDNLTLSERTTKGGKEITKQAASIIAEAIKKGKSVQKTALDLFDGYGYGHVLPTQDIPEFMKKLAEIGRLTDYKGREFRKTLRDVERQLKRVNVQGMKIAYGKIKEAIETGNEKKINKAVYVATQERTRYFARRIARTELARAYGDGAMAKWENDEDCVAFQWKLSTGHPFCDICDLYAHADLYGMGPGIFPKDKVPRLPVHPNCMCHLRPIMEGSKLLQGKEKEQIDKGGMAYIKTLDKHDQERLLGVNGRLEVLKKGNWTGKARGYSTEVMKGRVDKMFSELKNDCEINGIKFKQVELLKKQLSPEELIKKLAGGDRTKGSCSSLAFAYTGNRGGFDVIDFRGGESCNFFSKRSNIIKVAQLQGVTSFIEEHTNDFMAAKKLFSHIADDKEYYLAVGRHAAIVRKSDVGIEYLELQSPGQGRFPENKFSLLTEDRLERRFGCQKSHSIRGLGKIKIKSVLIETESLYNNKGFRTILGYINTEASKQQKGMGGNVR